MTDRAVLSAIEAADPDGGERRPTDADYAKHKAWAVAAFGPDAWATYRRGGWAESRDDIPATDDLSHSDEMPAECAGQLSLFS